VDDFAGTIRPLDVPEEVTTWGPNVDEFLWGWNGCRVIWQRPDGSFDHHDVACLNPEAGNTDPAWDSDGSLADWLEPGRLLIVEWSDSGAPLVVHASLDRGATWQRVKVRDRDWSDPTMVEIADALAEAMRQLT
jgi:hypothetical protein